jgi:mannose-6-phosphate isomerase-like protein (cupin superfamily)
MQENQIRVIARETIPPITSVQEGGEVHSLGELRDFRWNDQLREFMTARPAGEGFSISWVQLKYGETLDPHRHPIQSMMVFYGGSGQMLGDRTGPVLAGDIVFVPAGCEHGFVGGLDGLYGLSIQFGSGLYTVPEKPRVLFSEEANDFESVLAYNEKRIEGFVKRPIFEVLADGTLEDPVKRKRYLDALQIWVDGNQTLLFSRQATCAEPGYAGVFLQHMKEELGHDALHKERASGPPAGDAPGGRRDSVMEAVTNWFAYQMYVLDNAEKTAILHLVIENASAAYHKLAMPVLSKYVSNEYFEVHVENDGEHAAMGAALLRRESPKTYARLRQIVGEAWDMLEMMTDRVAEITRGEE